MKWLALGAGLVIFAPIGAGAQTTDQLVKGASDTSNVLNYGLGYNLQQYSPPTQFQRTMPRPWCRCGTTVLPTIAARNPSR
jgi:alcohol dehydrogenase (cytochrome c)